jgi:hypothetical protein
LRKPENKIESVMSENPFQNQHYISRALIKRFSTNGIVQKYYVKYDNWGQAGLRNTFSSDGYTQMLSQGKVDNTLEKTFSKVEALLPETLAALDSAAKRNKTALREELYKNFCWYLAFLQCLSPFFKAKSPVDFLDDLHRELIDGSGDILDVRLSMSLEEKKYFRHWILNGQKLIIDSKNYLQLLHRVQFNRVCRVYYNRFRFITDWHLCRSPIELPLSDMAITEMRFPLIHWYSLPIAPRLLLVGRIPQPEKLPSNQSMVYGVDLPLPNAENWKDLICLQARLALISKTQFPDAYERKLRAIRAGHAFANITEIDKVLAAGTADFIDEFSFKIVSVEEYKAFCSAFVC